MKRFTKTLLSVAAVSAVSAAMAVSAMAMSATYADGKVTFSNITDTGASQTLLILNKDATTVAESDIVQIDQKDNNENFNGLAVPVGELADGTYYVRIGGTNCPTLQTFTLEVKSTSPTTKDIIIGDVDEKGSINALDSRYLGRYVAKLTTNIGNAGKEYVLASDSTTKYIVGDVDNKGSINALDSRYLGRYVAKLTTNIGSAGDTVTVIAE